MDTKKFYHAQLETVDFKSKAEDARVNINSWVEKQTQGDCSYRQIYRCRRLILNLEILSYIFH